jgi:tetratricopeptide (TPR) repeat protein
MKYRKAGLEFILLITATLIFSNTYYYKTLVLNIMGPIEMQIATKNMKFTKLNNITYYYSNKSDGEKPTLDYIKNCINEGKNETTKIFGQTSVNSLNIVRFSTLESFGKTFNINPQENVSLYFGRSIYIPSENFYQYAFVHEYTHYKMDLFCSDKGLRIFNIPQWFQEGVAEYACSPFYGQKYSNPKLNKVQDYRKMDDNKGIKESQAQGYDAYMQGYLAVKKIIQLKGQNSIQNILINTKTMNFYDAFKKVVGLSIDDFQKLQENQLTSTDSVNALLNLGWTYSQQKKLDKAKDTFLEATKKYPDNELAWVNLGHSYIELGDFDNAIKSREKLISIADKKSIAYFYYSQLLITKDLNKAIAMAEKSAELAKTEKSDDPKFVMNYFLLIKSLKDNINLDKSLTQYVTLIKSDYLYWNVLKIDIINHVLAKYTGKNDNAKQQLIKLKSDLEKQK